MQSTRFAVHIAGLPLEDLSRVFCGEIMMTHYKDDTLPPEGSADVQGCQHWNLSALQQQQERYARRIRKAVLFEGAATLSKLVAALVEGALPPPLCLYAHADSLPAHHVRLLQCRIAMYYVCILKRDEQSWARHRCPFACASEIPTASAPFIWRPGGETRLLSLSCCGWARR